MENITILISASFGIKLGNCSIKPPILLNNSAVKTNKYLNFSYGKENGRIQIRM